jgi:5,6-dimethylbenzimidazole synthase
MAMADGALSVDEALRASVTPDILAGAAPVARAAVFAALRRACRGLADTPGAPWRFVEVTRWHLCESVRWNLEVCNAEVLARARADHPRRHDVAAIRDAPVQIGVFADAERHARGTSHECFAGEAAVTTTAAATARFRLCAADDGLGVRWVTALDAAALAHTLDVPARWHFIGYVCVGRPAAHPARIPNDAAVGDPLAGCLVNR